MLCDKCGKEVAEGSVFCNYCGNYINAENTKNLEGIKKKDSIDDETCKVCPSCGKFIKWEDKVCSYCGETYRKPQFTHIRGGIGHPVISDKNIRTPNSKRPISIVLVVLLGAAFFMTFIPLAAFGKSALGVIIFFPIFIIITFSLIFVNLRKNRKRMLGFLIATCVMVAILILASTLYALRPKNIESAETIITAAETTQTTIPETTQKTQVAEPTVETKDTSTKFGTKENPWPFDTVVTGKEVSWQLLSAKDMGNKLESNNMFTEDKTTIGKFIKVEAVVKNLGNEKKDLTFSTFNIVDNKGREFAELPESYAYTGEEIGTDFIKEINPGLEGNYIFIFEVPLDANGLMFEATDLNIVFPAKTYISLGL